MCGVFDFIFKEIFSFAQKMNRSPKIEESCLFSLRSNGKKTHGPHLFKVVIGEEIKTVLLLLNLEVCH